MIWGLDQLGAAKYADLAVGEQPTGWAFGVFTNTFGNALPVVERIAKQNRASAIRLQLAWADDHNYSNFNAIAKEAKRCAEVVQRYPGVKWYVSGATEHKLDGQKARQLSETVMTQMPSGVVYVNNPWVGKGAFLPGVVNEVHGSKAQKPNIEGPFAFSFDGNSAEDSDVTAVKERMSGAEYFLLWSCRFNLKWEDNDPTPRPQRKGKPDSNLIDSVIALHKDKGETKLPKNWIYKSHSENKGNGDPRAEHPVWIAPIKAKSIELRASNGQVVDVAKYYGPFADGRSRFYSPQWGYLTAQKAIRIQGNSMCEIWAGGKRYGVVNPSFRDGSWR